MGQVPGFPSDDNDSSSTEGVEEDYRDIRPFGRCFIDNGFWQAISSRDLDRLKDLIEVHGVDCIDESGHTILHLAAHYSGNGNTEILEYILSLDEVDKDAINRRRETPLFLCTSRMSFRAAEILIDAGADVTKASIQEMTPLHDSARFSVRLSQKLILAGADVNHMNDNGDTPLQYAVMVGALEIVCLLLYYGADVSIENSDNETPFTSSLPYEDKSMALEMFEYVTDFNLTTRNNMSTLFVAIKERFPRIIDMCERGADINWNGNSKYNVFNLGVFPKPQEFRYLWSRFDFDNWGNESTNILKSIVADTHLDAAEKIEILRIMFESEDFQKIAFSLEESSSLYPVIYSVVYMLHNEGVSHDMVHTFTACMVLCNTVVWDFDLDMVYEHYGYCETFKLLLYMDIKRPYERSWRQNMFPALIYRMSWRNEIEYRMSSLDYTINFFISHFHSVDYENIFDHTIYPRFKERALSLCASNKDAVPESRQLYEYLSATPHVPLLQDLARNRSRDFLCERYGIRSSCMFYTILKCLPLPKIAKQLIAFEIPLYKGDLMQEHSEIRSFLKSCRIAAMDYWMTPHTSEYPAD